MPKGIAYFAAAVLLIGAAPMPYGYYGLLRIIATVAFAWAAYTSYEQGRFFLPWILAGLALLFNPLIPVHLTKSVWTIVDIASAVFLISVSWFTGNDRLVAPSDRPRNQSNASAHKSTPNDPIFTTETFELAKLRNEQVRKSELMRAKLKYGAAQVAVFTLVKVPFFGAIVMMAADAFDSSILAGLMMSFFVFFSFFAFFVAPDDAMYPFLEMKARIRSLEQQSDGWNGERL